MVRGYQEDAGFDQLPKGKFFDITTPTWRLGEAILEGFYIAKALEVASGASLICHASWTNLSGRKLISRGNPLRIMFEDRTAFQGTYESTRTIELDGLPAALPELVFEILSPLYELFDFWRLPKRLVEEELAALQKRRF